jgi:hypothetical protein
VCTLAAGEPFAELRDVPVHTNVLWPTAEAARAATRGDISLVLCGGCGLIWNTRFDPDVLSYDAEYENSLHFSGAFRRYTEELSERLIATHELQGKHVAEIGPGKGEFLAELCERGNCTGIGFDPSYGGESDGRAGGRISFVRDVFGATSDLGDAELVICRHVLEHLDDPVGFLSTARRAMGERAATVYVEVPAAEYLIGEDAIWDLIYPHVTCFTAQALREALQRAGFYPLEHGYAFGGQYLWVEATTDPIRSAADWDGNRFVELAVDRFGERLASKRRLWSERLPRLLQEGQVGVWGAGAKGTMFLNVVAAGDKIDTIVDVNPRKHGKFVPGTGQRIRGPESLQAGTRTVLVMNPLYVNEIAATLGDLGRDVALLTA